MMGSEGLLKGHIKFVSHYSIDSIDNGFINVGENNYKILCGHLYKDGDGIIGRDDAGGWYFEICQVCFET